MRIEVHCVLLIILRSSVDKTKVGGKAWVDATCADDSLWRADVSKAVVT